MLFINLNDFLRFLRFRFLLLVAVPQRVDCGLQSLALFRYEHRTAHFEAGSHQIGQQTAAIDDDPRHVTIRAGRIDYGQVNVQPRDPNVGLDAVPALGQLPCQNLHETVAGDCGLGTVRFPASLGKLQVLAKHRWASSGPYPTETKITSCSAP